MLGILFLIISIITGRQLLDRIYPGYRLLAAKSYSGKEINLFDYRDKTQSVFERIPGGNLRLNWTGTFGFDLTLFEERSEPRDDNENKYKALVGTDKVLTVLED